MNVTAMCASGNAAMLTAKMWLDAGVASDVIVVASDLSATPENIRHFRNLGVVFPDAPALDVCRPFQEGSKGFAGGEASVGMVVGSARRRVRAPRRRDEPRRLPPDPPEPRPPGDPPLLPAGAEQREGVPERDRVPQRPRAGTAQCDAAEADMLDTLLTEAEVFSVKPLVGHCQGAASRSRWPRAAWATRTGSSRHPSRSRPGIHGWSTGRRCAGTG